MSTRCVISVTDKYGSWHIFRHWDGYPDNAPYGVLSSIGHALALSWPLPRFEADEFAACLVTEMKLRAFYPKNPGGNIRFTTGPDAHADIEFHYDVRHVRGDALTVRVGKPVWDSQGAIVSFDYAEPVRIKLPEVVPPLAAREPV